MSIDGKNGPATFEDVVRPLPASIRDAACAIREAIQASLPDADERIYGGAKIGMALYSINGENNVVCGIQPTATSCKVFFHAWESLVGQGFRLEGSGKNARHIKLRDASELQRLDLARMISMARAATGH